MGGKRTRPLLATAVSLGALAAAAAWPAGAGAAASCSLSGSHTVLSTPFARVYYDRAWRPFSCYRITGRRVRLDRHVDSFYAPRDAHLGLLRIAGRFLGFTWVDPGIPAVYVESVDMRTARWKRRTTVTPTVLIDPSAVAVTDLVARRGGSLAWIQRVEGEISVMRLDRHGRRRLDRGAGIALRSLGIRGERVVWRKDGVQRSAALPERR